MIIYKDFANNKLPLGEAELLEYKGDTEPFSKNGIPYKGEIWEVMFIDGTIDEVTIRVEIPIDREEPSQNLWQDRFQTYRDRKGKISSIYDTSFWNERIGDFTSFGNIY